MGKSSLVLRFITNEFKPYQESTIGASFMSKLIMVEGSPIKFQIWDTAGQEKYKSLAPMYYKVRRFWQSLAIGADMYGVCFQ